MTTPSTQITAEYIMTMHAPLEMPQSANADLLIYNTLPGDGSNRCTRCGLAPHHAKWYP